MAKFDASILWSPGQRAASLEATLAHRPDKGHVWLLGYGSLIWNPAFIYDEAVPALLEGWQRAFCLRLTAGRGTASRPGRMLALKTGGRTKGLAFRLPEEGLKEELTLVWKREMITGCYLPTWCSLQLADGRQVNGLVFVMDPSHPLYEVDTRLSTVAPLIAAASGPLGSNAEYLFSLEQALSARGMQDAEMTSLAGRVRDLMAPCAGTKEEQALD